MPNAISTIPAGSPPYSKILRLDILLSFLVVMGGASLWRQTAPSGTPPTLLAG